MTLKLVILGVLAALAGRADDNKADLIKVQKALDLETIKKDEAEIKAALIKAQTQFEKEASPFQAEAESIMVRRCAAEKIERADCDMDRKTGEMVRKPKPEAPKKP